MQYLYNRKQLADMVVPLVAEQILLVLVGMADVLMVSTLGKEAVSGVSLVDSINNLIIQVLFSMTAGGTVVCARFLGAKAHQEAERSAGQLLFITTLGTLIISAILILGNRSILTLIFGSAEEAVLDNAVTYLYLTSLSLPFMAVYNSGASIFRAQGNTRVSMLVSLVMNAINISGNAACIFGLGMGVEGVGIPTVVSRAIAAGSIAFLLNSKKNKVHIRRETVIRPDTLIIWRILTVGIPNSMESALFHTGKLIIQSLVVTLGTSATAAFAVASNLVTWLYLPGNAIGTALITIVAQCFGAREYEQARRYTRKMILVNYAMLAVICSVLVVGARFWVGLYSLTGETAVTAEKLITAHALAMAVWPLAFILPYYFRASGRAVFTMVVAVISMWLFRVGLAYLFVSVMNKDVLWVWYAMFIDWICRVIVFMAAFRKKNTSLKC